MGDEMKVRDGSGTLLHKSQLLETMLYIFCTNQKPVLSRTRFSSFQTREKFADNLASAFNSNIYTPEETGASCMQKSREELLL
jgi:hypothetical protein